MRHQIRHFQISEFRCPCCSRVQVAVALVFWLDVLRRFIKAPLVVNSGYRCPMRNAQVKGAGSSRHLIGCAADLRIPVGYTSESLLEVASRFVSENTWEIMAGSTYLHVGVPRTSESRLWHGENIIKFN